MGVSGDNKEFIRHKLIPIKIINKVMNSLSKISFKKEGKIITGKGFFNINFRYFKIFYYK